MSLDRQKTILFTGDSITAEGRNVDDINSLGNGFVSLVADMLLIRHPENDIKVINSGIGGNTIGHLLTRCYDDIIEHEPDVVVTLIGINDATRFQDKSSSLCLGPEEYRHAYQSLLSEVKQQLPNSELLLMTPFFISRGTHQTDSYRAQLMSLVKDYSSQVEKLAGQFDTSLIRLYELFSTVLRVRPSSLFSSDRIHPNRTGHMLIADAVYEMLRNKL